MVEYLKAIIVYNKTLGVSFLRFFWFLLNFLIILFDAINDLGDIPIGRSEVVIDPKSY